MARTAVQTTTRTRTMPVQGGLVSRLRQAVSGGPRLTSPSDDRAHYVPILDISEDEGRRMVLQPQIHGVVEFY